MYQCLECSCWRARLYWGVVVIGNKCRVLQPPGRGRDGPGTLPSRCVHLYTIWSLNYSKLIWFATNPLIKLLINLSQSKIIRIKHVYGMSEQNRFLEFSLLCCYSYSIVLWIPIHSLLRKFTLSVTGRRRRLLSKGEMTACCWATGFKDIYLLLYRGSIKHLMSASNLPCLSLNNKILRK